MIVFDFEEESLLSVFPSPLFYLDSLSRSGVAVFGLAFSQAIYSTLAAVTDLARMVSCHANARMVSCHAIVRMVSFRVIVRMVSCHVTSCRGTSFHAPFFRAIFSESDFVMMVLYHVAVPVLY